MLTGSLFDSLYQAHHSSAWNYFPLAVDRMVEQVQNCVHS